MKDKLKLIVIFGCNLLFLVLITFHVKDKFWNSNPIIIPITENTHLLFLFSGSTPKQVQSDF